MSAAPTEAPQLLPDRLVLATRNAGKLRELRAILADLGLGGVSVLSVGDFADVPEVVEDRGSFAGNASKKAETVAAATGLWAVADDSGLEVDALDGRPGVDSAYFAGPRASDADNNAKLLTELVGVPSERRTARYRCCIALAEPQPQLAPPSARTLFTVEAEWAGVVLDAPRGSGGFGYDPLILIPTLGQSVAEIEPARKNQLSHRGQAMRLFGQRLRQLRPAS